jgi:apolipoprotein D and lipocalin family protein
MKTISGFLICLLLAGCSSHPALPLAQVDLERRYGTWYIVATVPNRFERGLVGMRDEFSKRPDGDIREDFYKQRGGFDAPLKRFTVHDWVRSNSGGAHWRVQIFWPINLPFLLLYVDPDYRYALFGEENRSMGWIYSRTPELPDADYRSLLARNDQIQAQP